MHTDDSSRDAGHNQSFKAEDISVMEKSLNEANPTGPTSAVEHALSGAASAEVDGGENGERNSLAGLQETANEEEEAAPDVDEVIVPAADVVHGSAVADAASQDVEAEATKADTEADPRLSQIEFQPSSIGSISSEISDTPTEPQSPTLGIDPVEPNEDIPSSDPQVSLEDSKSIPTNDAPAILSVPTAGALKGADFADEASKTAVHEDIEESRHSGSRISQVESVPETIPTIPSEITHTPTEELESPSISQLESINFEETAATTSPDEALEPKDTFVGNEVIDAQEYDTILEARDDVEVDQQDSKPLNDISSRSVGADSDATKFVSELVVAPADPLDERIGSSVSLEATKTKATPEDKGLAEEDRKDEALAGVSPDETKEVEEPIVAEFPASMPGAVSAADDRGGNIDEASALVQSIGPAAEGTEATSVDSPVIDGNNAVDAEREGGLHSEQVESSDRFDEDYTHDSRPSGVLEAPTSESTPEVPAVEEQAPVREEIVSVDMSRTVSDKKVSEQTEPTVSPAEMAEAQPDDLSAVSPEPEEVLASNVEVEVTKAEAGMLLDEPASLQPESDATMQVPTVVSSDKGGEQVEDDDPTSLAEVVVKGSVKDEEHQSDAETGKHEDAHDQVDASNNKQEQANGEVPTHTAIASEDFIPEVDVELPTPGTECSLDLDYDVDPSTPLERRIAEAVGISPEQLASLPALSKDADATPGNSVPVPTEEVTETANDMVSRELPSSSAENPHNARIEEQVRSLEKPGRLIADVIMYRSMKTHCLRERYPWTNPPTMWCLRLV